MKFFDNRDKYTLLCVWLMPLLYIVFISNQGFAIDCDSPKLNQYRERIQKYVDRHELIEATTFSDSILYYIDNELFDDCEKIWWLKLTIGEVLELRKKYEEAINNYQRIIRISEKNHWWPLSAEAYISLGRTYEYLSSPTEELRYLNYAKSLISNHQLDSSFSRFCIRYSSYHRIFDNPDTAKVYAAKAVRLGKKYHIARSVYDGYLLLGILSDSINTSIKYFENAVKLFLDKEDYLGAAGQTINIAIELINQGKYTEALETIEKSESYISNVEKNTKAYYEKLAWLTKEKSNTFGKMHNIDSAYFYLKLYDKYNNNAQYYINQENIRLASVDFAVDKEKEKRKYIEKLSGLMMWGLMAIGLIALILLLLLYKHLKGTKEIRKQSEIIQSQKEELEELLNKQTILLSEVHHRVKNNLQLVISLLFLKSKSSKSKTQRDYFDDIAMKIYSISLIHQQLYRSKDFDEINLKLYFDNLSNYFKDLEKEKEKLKFELNIENICMNLDTVMPLGLISSELISNSIKYARIENEKLKIKMNIFKLDKQFVFKYSDNGPGVANIDKIEKIEKMGLRLIKSLVKQLQAESNFYNENGFRFNLIFTEKYISKV